jgi:hypothetical protein
VRPGQGLHTCVLGRGYGYPTSAAIEGTAIVKTLTGALGEITYSGKGLAVLRAIKLMLTVLGGLAHV